MTGSNKEDQDAAILARPKRYVGHLLRKQAPYGTIAVAASQGSTGLEPVVNPKRYFPRDGVVELQGAMNLSGLTVGDWLLFEVAKNPRFRAPEYRATNVERIPRFAPLPNSTLPLYRDLLVVEGWAGDNRQGLWSFGLAGDRVIVVEMAAGKDGRLRIPRDSRHSVKLFNGLGNCVFTTSNGTKGEQVLLLPDRVEPESLDWSADEDHVSGVIKALAGLADPAVPEVIAWLELHADTLSGGVNGGGDEKQYQLDPLRSAAIAKRLAADRDLMRVYLDAASQDESVRQQIAIYAREGAEAERERLRAEVIEDVSRERRRLTSLVEAEVANERERLSALARAELKLSDDLKRSELERNLREIESRAAEENLREATIASRQLSAIHDEIEGATLALAAVCAELSEKSAEVDAISASVSQARMDLEELKLEIDRSLSIIATMENPQLRSKGASKLAIASGVGREFPRYPLVAASEKWKLISNHMMLNEKGKDLVRRLVVLMMAGEIPVIAGSQANDLLLVAASIICPGRCVAMDADPTLISIDDLWARPGSGAPTLLAFAGEAAIDSGCVLVTLKQIERSGARFWLPSLVSENSSGGLPRALFICCTVADKQHEELRSIASEIAWIQADDILKPGTWSAAPRLLSDTRQNRGVLDPGLSHEDLSGALAILVDLERDLDIQTTMRVARIYTEALALTGDEPSAKALVMRILKDSIYSQTH